LAQTTPVNLTMTCARVTNSNSVDVVIDPSVSQCPSINTIAAVPFELKVGESMLFAASAKDSDTTGLTFNWYATSGNLGSPDEPSTTFECTAAGTALLTLTVSDGRCLDSEPFTVSCVDP
ncbi:MAG TPA: hypothetical protein VK524_33655, partial [Polyangiaceae bacterium]|nr:hypothetical protein [Polyangiaceae bacterium]